MKENLKTLQTKSKYANVNSRGRFVSCRICNHPFKHKNSAERDKWMNNKYLCPNCGEPYCNKPKTERELMNLQDLYLEAKQERTRRKYMDEICKIVISYTGSILKKKFSNYLSCNDDMVYFRDKAASFLIEEFYTKENYSVWGSWAGIINRKIMQALLEDKEKPIPVLLKERHKSKNLEIFSINYAFEDGHILTAEDPNQDKYMNSFENNHNKNLIHEFFLGCIRSFFRRYTNYEMYKTVKAMNLRYHTSSQRVAKFFEKWGKTGKWAYLRLSYLYKKEIKSII